MLAVTSEVNVKEFAKNPVKAVRKAIAEIEHESGMDILESVKEDFFNTYFPATKTMMECVAKITKEENKNKVVIEFKDGKLTCQ